MKIAKCIYCKKVYKDIDMDVFDCEECGGGLSEYDDDDLNDFFAEYDSDGF